MFEEIFHGLDGHVVLLFNGSLYSERRKSTIDVRFGFLPKRGTLASPGACRAGHPLSLDQ
jgi:hypothetical protein